MPMNSEQTTARPQGSLKSALYVLSLASGACGLIYEVLWFRHLGLLFGNTVYSSATVFSAFFLGLALGNQFFGGRSIKTKTPIRLYALVEFSIAGSALLYFALFGAYRHLLGILYPSIAPQAWLFTAGKFILAFPIVALPAFFMGGTYPALVQQLRAGSEEIGRTGTALYAINTVGAACGAFVAGFFLPPTLGYAGSYIAAVCCTVAIGVSAYALSTRVPASSPAGMPKPAKTDAARSLRQGDRQPSVLTTITAFTSGVCILALEVFWTRMLAQVFQNSVYTFSSILVVVLCSLAIGSFLAGRMVKGTRQDHMVIWLLLVCVAAVVVSAFLYGAVTGGRPVYGSGNGWLLYSIKVFATIAAVIGPSAVLMGMLFPYLLAKATGNSAGAVAGRLLAANTVGAVAGSLGAGFLALPILGSTDSLKLIAVFYAILAIAWSLRIGQRRAIGLTGALCCLVGALFIPLGSTLRPRRPPSERLIESVEGAGATVSVVETRSGLTMKLNSNYRLGGTRLLEQERLMAQLPLLIHPDAERVFFLGMGTGITAGAALFSPVDQVVVSELLPEVVELARRHFGDLANGLFSSPKGRILTQDGRHYLGFTKQRFDLVVGDLLNPEETGALFTREHFERVRGVLTEEGLFAQWLPLHQLTRREFKIVVRTFLEVFPHATLWRGNFFADKPIVCLMAHGHESSLDTNVVKQHMESFVEATRMDSTSKPVVPYVFYCGNLGAATELFRSAPIHTDNRPLVEYSVPVSPHSSQWFTGRRLAAFLVELREKVPPQQDPYLAAVSEGKRNLVDFGLSRYVSIVEEDRLQ